MVFSFISSNRKSIVAIIGFVCATEIAWKIYKKYISKKKGQLKFSPENLVIDTFFFSEKSAECRNHVGDGDIPCDMASCPINSINKLVSYLNSATRSVDICVYFLTFNRIGRAILELQRRNISIRVITDNEISGHASSIAFEMRKKGILVRSKKYENQYMMHHKFAIVDRKLLITGSANWTAQAFFGNCENIIVINHPKLVGAFINEFEKLWLRLSTENN